MTYQAQNAEMSLTKLWGASDDAVSQDTELELTRARRAVSVAELTGEPLKNQARSQASESGAEAVNPEVTAVDDILDVKLHLYPAGTRPASVYDELMGPTFHVRENYDFTSPEDGSAVAFSVSRFCADSIHNNNGYVNVPQSILSFSELREDGKMDLVHRAANRGQVTFRDLLPGKAMIVCDNEFAADKISPAATKATGTGLVSSFDYDFQPTHTDVTGNDNLINTGGYQTRIFFADGEEGYFDGGTWGRLVEGKYGLLAIHDHRLVQYVPRADPSIIGKVDVFPYKLVHPTAGTADANVIVRIGSDQADVKWNDSNPYAEALKAEVWDYANTATIKTISATTSEQVPGACSYNWEADSQTGELGVTGQTFEFTVDEASKSRLTIDIYAETLPSLLDNMRITLSSGQSSDLGRGGKFDIIKVDHSHLQAVSGDLSPGSYVLYVANGDRVSVSGYVDVDLTFDTTHFSFDSMKPASGNVLTNEGLNSETAAIAISRDGGTYQVLGEGGTRLYGNYGTLLLQADGDYVYEPNAELQGIAQLDTFRYQLQLNNGTVRDGRLTIAIRMDGGEGDSAVDDVPADVVSLENLDDSRDVVAGGNEQPEASAGRSQRSVADLMDSIAGNGGEITLSAGETDGSLSAVNPSAISAEPARPLSVEGTSASVDPLDHLSTAFDESAATGSQVI